MRFPDLLVQFLELERRQRMIDAELRYIRGQLLTIKGTEAFLHENVSRETDPEDARVHNDQPTLFDAPFSKEVNAHGRTHKA